MTGAGPHAQGLTVSVTTVPPCDHQGQASITNPVPLSRMKTTGCDCKAMPNRKTAQELNRVMWGDVEVKDGDATEQKCVCVRWRRSRSRRWRRRRGKVKPEEELKRLTLFLYCWEYISKSWLKERGNIKMKDNKNKQTYTWQTDKQKIYKRSC